MNEYNIIPALVTPFTHNGEIDYNSLDNLLDRIIEEGCKEFVVCGTTGESPTLSELEKYELLSYIINKCKDINIWFGLGNNNTLESIRMIKQAQKYPIKGFLVVCPYYNKPNQEGLYMHYKLISKATHKQIMIYNIPTRCSVDLKICTLKKLLKECKNITCIKETNFDETRVVELLKIKKNLRIYCGDDNYFISSIKKDFDGIISVIANYDYTLMNDIYNKYMNDEDFMYKIMLYDLYLSILKCDTNPIIIKYLLYSRGEIHNVLRLPLTPICTKKREIVDKILQLNQKKYD